jgi:hypothetical protein
MDLSNPKKRSSGKASGKIPTPTLTPDQFNQVSHKQLLKEITLKYGLLGQKPPQPNIEPIDLLDGGMQVTGTSMYEKIGKSPPVPSHTGTNEIRINETNINLDVRYPAPNKPEPTILPNLKSTNTSFYNAPRTTTHNPTKIISEKTNHMYFFPKKELMV